MAGTPWPAIVRRFPDKAWTPATHVMVSRRARDYGVGMDPADQEPGGRRGVNRVLSQMSDDDRCLVLDHATPARLSFGEELTTPDRPIVAAYFPESGVASIVKPDGQGERVEICLIGRESFAPAPLALGEQRWPYRTFVQTPELRAWRVDAAALAQCMDRSGSLRRTMLRAAHVQLVQICEGLVSASWQKLDARLARWLLMYRDRIDGERVEVTHEFMAAMISAQRTSVTSALHEMEGNGLIRSTRGTTVIRDVEGLRALADGGYGVAEQLVF